MEAKALTIQGYTNLQGSAVIGTTVDFQYYLLDIPELNKTNTNPLVIVFDIMATVVITGSATASYIGKHMSRRINATLLRNATGEYSVNTSFEQIHTDTEVEKAQTNLEIRDKKLYIKFTGTSYGHTFSCQANVLYTIAHSNFEQQKQITRKTLSSTIEDMAPSSGVIVIHNDTTNRNAADAHPAAAISYDNTAPTGDLSSIDVQNAIEEIGDLMDRGAQTGTITRALGEITQVDYVRAFGTTVVEITRVGGLITQVKTSYDDGVNPKIVRTKTLTYDGNNDLASWVIV